ncbi:MAG: DNA-formamidopyrimidine glycosylase family protein, partial [Prochlorococcus sp.]
MPELPEVETVRRGLANRLKLFQIEHVEVCRERAIASPGGSELFIRSLEGVRVGEWKRRGK